MNPPNSPTLELEILAGTYAVTRLDPDSPVPGWLPAAGLTALVRTTRELSVVCQEDAVPSHLMSERGWRCLGVVGILDFSLVGILAGLTAALAREKVSVFAVSTFDTDYVLVRAGDLDRALDALEVAGYRVSKTN